jgi:hypothetical protein
MPDTQESAPKKTKNAPGPRANKGSKTLAIVKAKQENPNLTTREIGKLVDCNHSNVIRVLQRYNIERNIVEEFKENRADLLAGLQEKVVKSVTVEDIQKAGIRDRMVVLGILHDHERLERGQSTQNVTHLHAVVRELQREEQIIDVDSNEQE